MPLFRFPILLPAFLLLATPTHAAQCGGDFNTFVANISREAAATGIRPTLRTEAVSGVTQDPALTSFDRRQRGRRRAAAADARRDPLAPDRISGGRAMLQ